MRGSCEDRSPLSANAAARRWRADLPARLRRGSYLYAGLIVGSALSLYAGTFAGMFLLPWWWARLLCLVINPLALGMLFVIGHDAGHNSLTPNRRLNRVLGRLLLLPNWHPFTSWVHAHNTLHHAWSNFKGRQPDFAPLTKEEYDALPRWRRWLERLYRNPLGVGVCYALDFWLLHLILPRRGTFWRSPHRLAFHLDRLLVAAFALGQIALAWVLAGHGSSPLPRPVLALGGVLIPWTAFLWFMGFLTFLQHTHPTLAWYDNEAEWSFYRVNLKSTAHVLFPWVVERLLHNIMDHAAHHLDPSIPLYRLTESQKLLEEQTPAHAVVVRWTLWDYFRTCAACKLYDFRRHCWTDFNGVATTPCHLAGKPDAALAPPPRKAA
jgi:omega-6 fatty acid desaturase (delta-12 desaturase)